MTAGFYLCGKAHRLFCIGRDISTFFRLTYGSYPFSFADWIGVIAAAEHWPVRNNSENSQRGPTPGLDFHPVVNLLKVAEGTSLSR